MSPGNEDLEELAKEIRRLIDSNKAFLEKVSDDAYEDAEDEGEPGGRGEETDSELEDYEEL